MATARGQMGDDGKAVSDRKAAGVPNSAASSVRCVAGLRLCRRDRVTLLSTTALQAVAVLMTVTPAAAQLAPTARPQNGQVVGGQVSITQNPQTTTVQQGSQLGAVNWQSFNVGSSHTVTFQQPNRSAVTLNRVVGPDPSVIAGRINANGNVVLVNQSGVVFDRGAQVDVQGLIVTSNNIRTQDFMAGRMNFDQPGNPNARIVNNGQITVKESGLAALVAPSVANHGVINARMGKVVLAGATAHTIDLYGDGLVAVDVTGQVKQAPVGPDGKAATVLVTNTGTILADGGTVVLTAKAVDGIVTNLVTAGGTIRANTVGNKVGRIELSGVGGGLVIEGDIAAMGTLAGSVGGTVQALATDGVTVAGAARVNASGQAGGGTVAIGTTLARAAGPAVKNVPAARTVTIETGARIAADATVNGKGGSIVMLATGSTRMNGSITARGGARGGDGGFVEISGKTLSSITGAVDVTAPAGTSGSILIDPDFLTIVADNAGNGDHDGTFGGAPGTIVAGDPSIGTDTLSNGVLNAFAGDVLLQANQTITVGANVNLTNSPGQSLTLEAGGTIVVNAGVVLTVDGNVVLATGGAGLSGAPPAAQPSPLISVLGSIQSNVGAITLLAGAGGVIDVGAAGVIQAATAATLTATEMNVAGSIAAPTISLTATTGTIGLSGTLMAPIAGFLAGQAGIVGGTGSILGGGTLTATSAAGAVTLTNVNNAIAALTGSSAGSFSFVNSEALTLGTVTATGGNVFLRSTHVDGLIFDAGAAVTSVPGGMVTLQADRIVNLGTVGATATVDAGATGIFELAPNTLGAPVSLGSVIAGTLSLETLDFIRAGLVRIGSVTPPGTGATTLAGSIAVGGAGFDLATAMGGAPATLELHAVAGGGGTGDIGQTAPLLSVGTLAGTGASINLANAANDIAVVSTIAVTGGVTLTSATALTLGTVTTGTAVIIEAPTLAVAGTISAVDVSLTANVGTLTLTGTVDATGSVTLIGQAGVAGGTGLLSGDGALSASSAGGAVDLGNVNNDVATASGAALTAFTLADANALNVGTISAGTTATITAATLTASGSIGAPTVSLTATADTLDVTGIVAATTLAVISGPTVTVPGTVMAATASITATAGTLTVDGTLDVTTAVLAGQAGIAAASGQIIGGTSLTANSALGTVDLTGSSNAITSAAGNAFDAFSITSTIDLNLGIVVAGAGVTATAPTLTAAGSIDAATVTLAATAGPLGITGPVTGTLQVIGTGTDVTAPSVIATDSATLTATAGTLDVAGTVTATVNAILSGPTVFLGGTVVSDDVALNATLGTLTITGVVDAATKAALSGFAGIAGTGRIIGLGTLTADSTNGSVALTNSANLVAAASGSSLGSFALVDSAPLNLGTVAAGGTVTVDAPTLTVSGSITAPTVLLTATTGALGITGTVAASVASVLSGQTGIDGVAGRIIGDGSLTATSAGGAVDLTDPNNAVTFATGSAATAFALTDSAALTLGGITAGTSVTVFAPGLTVPDPITAGTVVLAATTGPLDIIGTVNAGTLAVGQGAVVTLSGTVVAPTVSLIANAGTLGIVGTIDAATAAVLAGEAGIIGGVPGVILGNGVLVANSATGSVDLTNPANVISSASGLVAGSFVLDNSVALDLGVVIAGGGVAFRAPTITVSGAIAAPTVSLTATTGTLGITGIVFATTAAVLSGQAGIIGPTGTILGGGALSAISAAGSVDLTGTANVIGSLEGTAPGSFRVTDSAALTIATGKSVTADTVQISALGITNDGTVNASGPGTVSEPALRLIATGGPIVNTGLIRAPDVGAGNVSLSAATGITSSGVITAAGPGSLSAPSLTLTTSGGSVIQTAGTIAATHADSVLSVAAPQGGIAFAGTLMTGSSSVPPTGTINLSALTDATEVVAGGTTGAIVTGLLTGVVGGDIVLTNAATPGNRITTVGSMTAGGGLALTDFRDLTVSGPVTANGGPLVLDVRAGDGMPGSLTNIGTIAANAPGTGTVRLIAEGVINNLAGATIAAAGVGTADTPSVALIALGGTIGHAAGATILASNPISGTIALTAASDIVSAGTISAQGNAAIAGAGTSGVALTSGGVIAQTAGLIAAANAIGSVSMTANGIDLAGTINVGTTGTLTLAAAGPITEGGGTVVGNGLGTIVAGLLTGRSGETTTLDTIANQIGTIGPFAAFDNLTLRNSAPTLGVAGAVTVAGAEGTLVLQNGVTGGGNDLTLLPGASLRASSVSLLAPDVINGPGARIDAATLILPNALTGAVGTGLGVTSARQIILGDPAAANPIPLNAVGTIGAVVATESLVFMDATALLLNGDISAPAIRIGATGALTIANDVTVTTGGTVIPLPAQSSVPPDTDATSGFNIALLGGSGTVDLGPRLTINAAPGVIQPTLRIAQTQGGQVLFGTLLAPSTNVVLHIGTGRASSRGGTNIDVENLFLFYRSGAPSVDLFGTVNGQTGSGAATISRIARETTTLAFGPTPAGALVFEPSPVFQINQCGITSVNCVLTSTLQVPPQLPLPALYVLPPINVLDDPDLLLPFISDEDD